MEGFFYFLFTVLGVIIMYFFIKTSAKHGVLEALEKYEKNKIEKD